MNDSKNLVWALPPLAPIDPPLSTTPNDKVHDLLALPARLCSIALTNSTSAADVEFLASTKFSDRFNKAIPQKILSIWMVLSINK